MITYPNVKINLGLSVLNKRPDGFHNLETLFVPCYAFRDSLSICPNGLQETGIQIIGGDWDPKTDLTYRAWELLRDKFGISGVDIILEKNSPVGAGLGGGSADGAFALRMLNEIFSLGLSKEYLVYFASMLGSDCPFFIFNRPMLGLEKGDILEEYDLSFLKGYNLRVEVPQGVKVSTKEAYHSVVPRTQPTAKDDHEMSLRGRQTVAIPSNELEVSSNRELLALRDALKYPVDQWKNVLVNDFERSVFPLHPEIAQLKQKLYDQGAIYASMSGSGSAVFGIFA